MVQLDNYRSEALRHRDGEAQPGRETAGAQVVDLADIRNKQELDEVTRAADAEEARDLIEEAEPKVAAAKPEKSEPTLEERLQNPRNQFIYRALTTDPFAREFGHEDGSAVGHLLRARENGRDQEVVDSLHKTALNTERAAALVYDMLHDRKVAEQVFKHRQAEGRSPLVVNMAAQTYSYFKRAESARSPQNQEKHFKTALRMMLISGGSLVQQGMDKNPPATNPRELWWKTSGAVRRAFRGRGRS